MSKKWNYNGDMNLSEGGFFWRDDDTLKHGYVEAVTVEPCSVGGGPDNVFLITAGSILVFEKGSARRMQALSCIGEEPDLATLVQACKAYAGLERGTEHVVRVGPVDPFWNDRGGGWNPTPDKILRANASLDNYVKKEFL